MKTHKLCAIVIPFNNKRKGLSNLTGSFPHKSRGGNLYVMVMHDYDNNTILSEPIKNRQEEIIRDDFLKMHTIIKSIGSDPNVQMMYNESSSDLK